MEQWILIGFIVILLIAYPIMIYVRNKKDSQKMAEQTNSLKKGDKILTTSGIYGTVVDVHLDENKKIVTIETGMGKNKGYMAVDAYAIYTVFTDEAAPAQTVETTKMTEVAEVKEEPAKIEDKKETKPKTRTRKKAE